MSYFLNLARLALGSGTRIEPRTVPEWEDGLEAAEVEPTFPAVPPVSIGEVAPAANGPASEIVSEGEAPLAPQTFTTNVTNSAQLSESVENNVTAETRFESVVRETERSTHRVETVRESLRELVREARTIRERVDRESIHTQTERTKELSKQETVERRTEIEKLVREVERVLPQKENLRTVGAEQESQGPQIEINIGRIEVRAPVPWRKPSKDGIEKPKGVIDLDEYLRQRSQGAS